MRVTLFYISEAELCVGNEFSRVVTCENADPTRNVPEKYCTNAWCYLVTQIQTYPMQMRSNSNFTIYLNNLKTIKMKLSSIKYRDAFKMYFRAADLMCKARHLFLSYELKSLLLLLFEVKESFITVFKDGQIRAQISIWNYVQ